MPPNKEANSFASPPAGLICLPPISEELQLVWTQAAQTSELDGNEHLLRTFSYFPYPSLADIALLCLRYGLQMEKVKTWFMAQRLRCGISWSSEEIEETRARVVYNRDQLHFKSLLSLTHHAGRPPEDVSPTPVPPSDSDDTHISPLALNEPPQVKRLKMEPEESSSLSLSHHKAKDPLVAPGNGAFPHQPPGFWQELQSGLSKELVSRGSDHQPHGLGTAAWDHSTSFHLSHSRDRPSPITLLANSCKQEPASILPPSSSTSSSSFRVMANGATATSKPLQSLGCVPQPPSPSEQALPPHLEPAWPQGLRHSPGPGRVAPAEYYFPDMQRQRKTKRKTKEQLAILKSFFLQCQWARREDYCKLEQITGLPRPEIIQWFGDTRYALKHGQLKWFRDNAVPGPPSYQEPATPTPQPVARPLQEWAEMPPPPLPPPPPDTSPLERYWTVHQQLREEDLPRLSLESGLSTQQVVDWFYSRSPEPAEVVVCLDEEDEEEEEDDLPEEDGGEEEEEEEEEEDEVIIQD